MQSTESANGTQGRRFSITFWIEGVPYWVIPLRDVHPEVARKAYRFKKRDPRGKVVAVYDVRLTPQGYVECDCPGHTRWANCKHRRTLQAAGMLPADPSRQ